MASSVTSCNVGSGHSITRWWEPPTCRVAAIAPASSTVAVERNARRRRAGVQGRVYASSTAAAASCAISTKLNACVAITSMPNTQLITDVPLKVVA